MSKIAEKKSLEEFPQINPPYNTNIEAEVNAIHAFNREGYVKGYDQAMEDFLEKAEEFLYLQLNKGSIECGNIERLIEQFKNYMQDE